MPAVRGGAVSGSAGVARRRVPTDPATALAASTTVRDGRNGSPHGRGHGSALEPVGDAPDEASSRGRSRCPPRPPDRASRRSRAAARHAAGARSGSSSPMTISAPNRSVPGSCRSWSRWTKREPAEDQALADQRRAQQRDPDGPRPARPVPPDRPRATHDRARRRGRRAPDRRRVGGPDDPDPRAEDREQQVVRGDRAEQRDQAAQRAGRDRPGRAAEEERHREPHADGVGRDEQRGRPGQLVGQPGGSPERGAARRSTPRGRRPPA